MTFITIQCYDGSRHEGLVFFTRHTVLVRTVNLQGLIVRGEKNMTDSCKRSATKSTIEILDMKNMIDTSCNRRATKPIFDVLDRETQASRVKKMIYHPQNQMSARWESNTIMHCIL